ncbi:MAG: class II aldolase/adducin family protein [Candidatus Kariarchaeaceae archaeon]
MNIEGTIKFELNHSFVKIDENYSSIFQSINRLRTILWEMNLIGVYPPTHSEANLGFGNASQRLNKTDSFLITGTQTGSKRVLVEADYSLVEAFELTKGTVNSIGLTKPSSEALTHAAIYSIAPEVQFVFHMHSLLLWEKTEELNMVTTDEKAQYGSLELVKAIQSVYSQGKTGLVSLLGHKEGLLIWGEDGEEMIEQVKAAIKQIS